VNSETRKLELVRAREHQISPAIRRRDEPKRFDRPDAEFQACHGTLAAMACAKEVRENPVEIGEEAFAAIAGEINVSPEQLWQSHAVAPGATIRLDAPHVGSLPQEARLDQGARGERCLSKTQQRTAQRMTQKARWDIE
jgi:hypothetical protein